MEEHSSISASIFMFIKETYLLHWRYLNILFETRFSLVFHLLNYISFQIKYCFVKKEVSFFEICILAYIFRHFVSYSFGLIRFSFLFFFVFWADLAALGVLI